MSKRNEGWRLLFGVCVVTALIGACLSGCGILGMGRPTRDFGASDLLLDAVDLPEGFAVYKEPFLPEGENWASRESIEVVWDRPGADAPASQAVFRKTDAGSARRVFKNTYLHYAATFPVQGGLEFTSPVAVSTSFVCQTVMWPGDREVTLCEWAAVYEEYMVIFSATRAPEGMTMEDIEKVVRAIDARFAKYLHLGDEK